MSTDVWSDTAPLGSQNANTADDELRKVRLGIRERMVQGGHKYALSVTSANTSENEDGKHCVGVEDEVGDDTGVLTLAWDFAGTVAKIVYHGGSHATKADRTEFPGDIGFSGTGRFLGVADGARIRAILSDGVPVANTRIKRVMYKVPGGTGAINRTLTLIRVVVAVRPTVDNLVVELFKQAAPADSVDRFAGGTSLGTVTLTPASSDFSAEATVSQVLAPDDEIIAAYGATVGSAADVSIIAQIE